MTKNETAWTPEPWNVCGGFGPKYMAIHSSHGYICFEFANEDTRENDKPVKRPDDETQRANARRIVSCVNACRGMADPEKEIAELRAGRAESAAEIERLRGAMEETAKRLTPAQGARLVAALAALAPDAGREGITTAQKLDAAKEVLRDIVSDCEGAIHPGLYKLAKDALEQLK